MIRVNGIKLEPTIFPDGTSQIWKLPPQLFQASALHVDWRFESERELIDLFSLRQLFPEAYFDLYVPYLPYGRQDKKVSNEQTFNLRTFAQLLNQLRADCVTTLDAHNPKLSSELIARHESVRVGHLQRKVIERLPEAVIVYPDEGALKRYGGYFTSGRFVVFEKVRNQKTGEIIAHGIQTAHIDAMSSKNFIILDDICDGGATFISVATAIRSVRADAHVSLFVTHGIFSKGRDHLLKNGIDQIFTTNSLPRNENFEGVIRV